MKLKATIFYKVNFRTEATAKKKSKNKKTKQIGSERIGSVGKGINCDIPSWIGSRRCRLKLFKFGKAFQFEQDG